MSNKVDNNSKCKKISESVTSVRSAEDLCKLLNELVKQPEWDIKTAEQFINLIINNQKQFLLNTQQQDMLVSAIIKCPIKYRSIVNLSIISANYCSKDGLRTLDNVTHKISNFLSETLDLKEGIKENIINNIGDKQVIRYIKEEGNIKYLKRDNSIQKKDDIKLDFFRNLISFLICEGEESAIATRLNIILDVLSGLNQYEKFLAIPLDSKIDIKNRVKAVTELLKLKKPNANEAKRLSLYGTQSQIIVLQQTQIISELNETLQRERKLREQKEEELSNLKQEYQELNQQLLDAKKKSEIKQNIIEQERQLYTQLETSSQAKISQQREATLRNIRNRIEHELNKLEQCLKGSSNSFQENSQIGLKVIQKIRDKLVE
jgi:hypothetical protein